MRSRLATTISCWGMVSEAKLAGRTIGPMPSAARARLMSPSAEAPHAAPLGAVAQSSIVAGLGSRLAAGSNTAGAALIASAVIVAWAEARRTTCRAVPVTTAAAEAGAANPSASAAANKAIAGAHLIRCCPGAIAVSSQPPLRRLGRP